MISIDTKSISSAPSSAPVFGLEGVVVAETRLSDVDGARGRLTLVGHALESLVAHSHFEQVAALLWWGRPATPSELTLVEQSLGVARRLAHAKLLEQPARLAALDCMTALRASVAAFVPKQGDGRLPPHVDEALGLAALVGVASAHWVRARSADALLEPDPRAPHAADLMRLMHGKTPTPAAQRALDTYLMTVADHGLNASTFTARVIASTGSDLVSAITGAIGALKGPLHGGAPGPVLDMLEAIGSEDHALEWLERELASGRRIMGMGHRVYRVRDPRASLLEAALEGLSNDCAKLRAKVALARAVET